MAAVSGLHAERLRDITPMMEHQLAHTMGNEIKAGGA